MPKAPKKAKAAKAAPTDPKELIRSALTPHMKELQEAQQMIQAGQIKQANAYARIGQIYALIDRRILDRDSGLQLNLTTLELEPAGTVAPAAPAAPAKAPTRQAARRTKRGKR